MNCAHNSHRKGEDVINDILEHLIDRESVIIRCRLIIHEGYPRALCQMTAVTYHL